MQQMSISWKGFWLFLCPLLFLIAGCKSLDRDEWVLPQQISHLHSYIHGDSINSNFQKLEAFVISRDFNQVKDSLEVILSSELLTSGERIFFENLSLEIRMKASGMLEFSEETLEELAFSDTTESNVSNRVAQLLNRSRWHFARGEFRKSINMAHLGLNLLSEVRVDTFAGFSEIHGLIGKAYMHLPSFRDSAFFHFDRAVQVASADESALWMLSESALSLAYLDLIKRDNLSAQFHLDLALTNRGLKSRADSLFISQCHSLKGKVYRKQQMKQASMMEFKIAYGYLPKTGSANSIGYTEYFSEILFAANVWKDDELWSKTMEDWRTLYPGNFKKRAARVLGFEHFGKGRYDSAAHYYRKDLAIRMSEPKRNFTIIDQAFNYLPKAYSKMGKFDSAFYYAFNGLNYQINNEMSEVDLNMLRSPKAYDQTYSFYTYHLMGSVLLEDYLDDNQRVSQLKEAEEMYRIMDSIMVYQVREWEEDALLAFSKISNEVYTNAIEIVFQLYTLSKETMYISAAHRYIEATKGMQLYRDVITSHADFFPKVPKSIKVQEREIKADISASKRLELRGVDMGGRSSMSKANQLRKLLDKIKLEYPDYYQQRYMIDPPLLQEVTAYSRDKETQILSYFTSDKYIYALFWGEESVAFNRISVTPDLTANLNFMDSLAFFASEGYGGSKAKFREYVNSASALYDQLFTQNDMELNARPLLILSSGRLDRLAFDALLKSKPQSLNKIDYSSLDYLVRLTPVSHSYSFKDLLRTETKKHSGGQTLPHKSIFAYAYGQESELPLPHSEITLNRLNEVYNGEGRFAVGSSISIEEFKKELQQDVGVIHLATHAYSSQSKRVDNRIVLAGDSNQVLYGYELHTMSIDADLVVLSACNTASGVIAPGEGTFSLTRSFLISGAGSVISTLWQVPDKSTSRISQSLHTYWAAGEKPSIALKMAKQAYLENQDAYSSHPGTWAGMRCFVR